MLLWFGLKSQRSVKEAVATLGISVSWSLPPAVLEEKLVLILFPLSASRKKTGEPIEAAWSVTAWRGVADRCRVQCTLPLVHTNLPHKMSFLVDLVGGVVYT